MTTYDDHTNNTIRTGYSQQAIATEIESLHKRMSTQIASLAEYAEKTVNSLRAELTTVRADQVNLHKELHDVRIELIQANHDLYVARRECLAANNQLNEFRLMMDNVRKCSADSIPQDIMSEFAAIPDQPTPTISMVIFVKVPTKCGTYTIAAPRSGELWGIETEPNQFLPTPSRHPIEECKIHRNAIATAVIALSSHLVAFSDSLHAAIII